jgi:hypothetical protein
MPTSENTRRITTLIKHLKESITSGRSRQVDRDLFRLNVTDVDIQFAVRDDQICVQLRNGRSDAPVSVMSLAGYVERLHADGTVEVLKDREGDTCVEPDRPDFAQSEPSEPRSSWEHIMDDDGS